MKSSKVRYTIRDVDRVLDKVVREKASHYGLSLNKTVLYLLGKAAGLEKESKVDRESVEPPALVFESWTETEIKEMKTHLRESRKIDRMLWEGK